MNVPSVGCIIPVHNGEQYIAECVDSVLEQSVPMSSIVVVDDGSTDETPMIISRYGDKIRIVKQENSGVSAARNRGIRESNTDYICFLDADDRYRRDKTSSQLDFMQIHPTVDFCDGYSRYFWSQEMGVDELNSDSRYQHKFWQTEQPGHISTWMVRRSVFDSVGYFDEALRYSEDSDWLLRFKSLNHSARRQDITLSDRRLHKCNCTSFNRVEQVQSLARVFRRSRLRNVNA